jgi:hypothetical protein
LKGFKRNPPGAYQNPSPSYDAAALNWNFVLSTIDGAGNSWSLVDDGLGNLWDPGNNSIGVPSDIITSLSVPRGHIDYLTGIVTATFPIVIAVGVPINAQYVPYVPSRPQSAVFYQDQIALYPIPDQAYTVSFECYMYPTAFLSGAGTGSQVPQLAEWWQLLAYGAADKIFADNADMENMSKFRPLLDEQMRLCLRRTLVQQTSERVSTIYSEQQAPLGQYPFGNNFSF